MLFSELSKDLGGGFEKKKTIEFIWKQQKKSQIEFPN